MRWQVPPLLLLWETFEDREGLAFLKGCVHICLGCAPTPHSPFFQIREFIVELFQNPFLFICLFLNLSPEEEATLICDIYCIFLVPTSQWL